MSIVAIQSQLTNTYLSVCNECNNIPGNSVDTHVTAVSASTPWALWQVVNVGMDQLAFINQSTGTYLTVCSGCNGLPGFSVDVHSAALGAWSTWNLTQGLGSGVGFLNGLTQSFLTKTSSGVTVNVSGTTYSAGTSWNIIAIGAPVTPLVPVPGPVPSPVFPPLTPLNPIVPPAPSPTPINPTPTPLIPIIPGPTPLYPPLTPLVPTPTPVNPIPTPLYPPLTPLNPIVPPSPSPSPLYPPLTPLNPPYFPPTPPGPPGPPTPTPPIPIYPPLTPLGPGSSGSEKVHPRWALWTGLGMILVGAVSFLLGLVTDRKFFTFSGLGMLGLGLIFALIYIFA